MRITHRTNTRFAGDICLCLANLRKGKDTTMTSDLVAPFNEERTWILTEALGPMTGLHVYTRSITVARESIFFLGRNGVKKSLGLISDDRNLLGNFSGSSSEVRLDDQPKT